MPAETRQGTSLCPPCPLREGSGASEGALGRVATDSAAWEPERRAREKSAHGDGRCDGRGSPRQRFARGRPCAGWQAAGMSTAVVCVRGNYGVKSSWWLLQRRPPAPQRMAAADLAPAACVYHSPGSFCRPALAPIAARRCTGRVETLLTLPLSHYLALPSASLLLLLASMLPHPTLTVWHSRSAFLVAHPHC